MKDHDDKVDAVKISFEPEELAKLSQEKAAEIVRIFERIERYKKISAVGIGMIYGTVNSAGTPFWIMVVYAITVILAVNVVWQIISRWGTERLGLDG